MATSNTVTETFPGRPDQILVALHDAVLGLGMEIIAYDPYAGALQFRTRMSVWSWGENLHARVGVAGAGTVAVEITSGLKFGLVDWGRNRRNNEKVFAALRDRLASGRYDQAAVTQEGPEGAWHPDPAGRHQLRWWNGQRWTEHVNDHGTPGTDPLLEPPVG